jgi:hypothetical protein
VDNAIDEEYFSMERAVWTDERIDDAMTRIDRGFTELREEMRDMRTDLRTEMREMRSETREDFAALRSDMGAWQRQQAMIGWGIALALLAQLVAGVIALG